MYEFVMDNEVYLINIDYGASSHNFINMIIGHKKDLDIEYDLILEIREDKEDRVWTSYRFASNLKYSYMTDSEVVIGQDKDGDIWIGDTKYPISEEGQLFLERIYPIIKPMIPEMQAGIIMGI